MTIEQTVEIPADHRLTIEVPPEIPAGKAVLAFTPAGEARPRRRLTERQKAVVGKGWGIGKGVLSSDESLVMRREELELEEEKPRRSTPLTDRLCGLLSHVGDISPEEIRAERLSKYLK
jgi:hypothetical protein